MSKRTERELRNAVNDLRDDHAPHDIAEVRVGWANAAPAERPEGKAWVPGDPDADEENTPAATLQYDLWSAQRDALNRLQDHDDDVVAFLGGYGSGKSVFGARWLIAQALQHPGSKFLAMGVSFQEARDTTYTKLFAALPGERTTRITGDFNGPEQSPIVDDYNRQEHRVTLTNDSVIVLGSADKYSRFAGAEFGGAWLDEPSHYGETLHPLLGMLTTRLRSVDGPKKQLWTLTGEGYNAAWEILEKRHDADGEPIRLNIHVTKASVLDNPYLPEGEKEAFKRQYGRTSKAEQALHGGFAAATGLVYSEFSRETHVIPEREASRRVEDEWRVYGYDAGWSDPRVLLEVGKTPYGQLVVLDVFHRPSSHVKDAIQWLEQKQKPTGTIYAEHEPADIDKFEKAGWAVEKADKSLDAGISEVKRRLRDDGNDDIAENVGTFMVSSTWYSPLDRSPQETTDDEGDDLSEECIGLLVSDRCQTVIREFLGYKEEHVGTAKAVDHCLDSLRYLAMGVSGGGQRR